MEIGKNIKEDIRKSINWSNNSLSNVLRDSVYYATSSDVCESIEELIRWSINTPIRLIIKRI